MSTIGRSTRFHKEGFTLFELLIVIAIIAVIAGLVVPQINMSTGGDGIESAVRFVRGAMDQGRTQAKLTRSDIVLVFGPTSVRFADGEKAISFPDSVRFQEIIFVGESDRSENELLINRRGITSTAIIRIEVGGQLYSLFVSPVIRELEYKKGSARFTDFAN